MNSNMLLGFDIGGTKCAAVLGRLAGGTLEIVARAAMPTRLDIRAGDFLAALFDCAGELMRKHSVASCGIKGIGVSCGGPLDSASGVILSPPNLPGWDGVPIVTLTQDRFGVKARLQNDANACALAEWKHGAARGCRNIVFLTFGTGMGAGLILNGSLYEGTRGMAGEIGHVRLSEHGPVGYGKQGSFEGFCSGGGIAQLARAMALERLQRGLPVSFCSSAADLPAVDAKTVAEAAAGGDELARKIFAVSGRQLGRGLSMLIDVLDPDVIVIGGIFARCEPLLRGAMEEAIAMESLAQSASACRIVPAALGERIGDYAALAVAAECGEDEGIARG